MHQLFYFMLELLIRMYKYCYILVTFKYMAMTLFQCTVEKNMGDLDPHVYAVAEEAFKRMERYIT